MKTAKRAVLLVLCAMLLVIASVLGTMAYLTDTADVKNTFTVGDVQIKLDEAKVDEYGYPVVPAERVIENSYKLVPNGYYTKDPTVTVLAKSEPSYVRMFLTIDKIDLLKGWFGSDFDMTSFFLGFDMKEWQYVDFKTDTTNMTRTYEFRYIGSKSMADKVGVVDARQGEVVLDALFDELHVPANVTNEQLQTLQTMNISVVAEAIQAEGFADANAAWAGFDYQNK